MKLDKNIEFSQYILDECTIFFGIESMSKVDSATLEIKKAKRILGVFEIEIKEFLHFLEKLNIINKLIYVEYGDESSWEFDINVAKMKDFIQQGAGSKTVFDSLNSHIYFNLEELSIPRDTDQFYFCKKMYEYQTKQWVSWDEIYEEMKGVKSDNFMTKTEKYFWKIVYDTMTEINKKAKDKLKIEELFKYEKHEFMRTI